MLSNGKAESDIDGVLTASAAFLYHQKKIIIIKQYFPFGEKSTIWIKTTHSYIKEICILVFEYMFAHVVGFYLPYKVSLKDDNMYFLNYDQWNASAPWYGGNIRRKELSKVNIGNEKLVKVTKCSNLP